MAENVVRSNIITLLGIVESTKKLICNKNKYRIVTVTGLNLSIVLSSLISVNILMTINIVLIGLVINIVFMVLFDKYLQYDKKVSLHISDMQNAINHDHSLQILQSSNVEMMFNDILKYVRVLFGVIIISVMSIIAFIVSITLTLNQVFMIIK